MNLPYHPADEHVLGKLSHSHSQRMVGQLLLQAGKLDADGTERVLRMQQKEKLRFGEAAIKLGLIKEADLHHALANQFDYAYLAPGDGHFSPDLVAAYQPFSLQVERLRALRGQLMLRWFSAGHKALAITGIHPGDGASYLAANLAVVFSQLGERTLLIDADLRHPRQHVLFNLGHRPGLSDILAGRTSLSAVTRIPNLLNLSVLTAGTVPPNPAELLSRAETPVTLGDFAEHYDVILIDTSAAEAAADAIMVAARTQGTLLVLRQDRTQLATAAAFKAHLNSAGAILVGSVLNQY
ncbi:MAG: chain length determinant protein tyrosine kinase EpsG [Burkholderiales bacterium]